MQECFWDENTKTMQMCISGAYLSGRATTISRSVQIVGNTTNKVVNENFTLCEGNNYIDCESDITGADLLVEDDIESMGSIFSQENITADNTGFFSWLGSLTNRITKLWVQDININGTIDGSGSIDITGNINTDSNLTVEGDFELGGDLKLENNLNVDKNITAEKIHAEQYFANNGELGVTDDSSYSVCIDVNGATCDEWCTLEITGGLITGCS